MMKLCINKAKFVDTLGILQENEFPRSNWKYLRIRKRRDLVMFVNKNEDFC